MVKRKMLKQHVVYIVPPEKQVDVLFYRQLQTVSGLLPCTVLRWNGQQSLVFMTHDKEPIKESGQKRTAVITLLECVERVMQDDVLCVTCLSLLEEDIWVDKQTGFVGLVYCDCQEHMSEASFGEMLQQRVYSMCEPTIRHVLASWLSLDGEQALRELRQVIERLTQREHVLESLHADVPFCWTMSKKDAFVIGKSVHANGCLVHNDSVSHIHCRVQYDRQAWWIEDLGSINGTFVDGTALLPFHKQKIEVGKPIRIADVTCQLQERYAL